MYQLHNHGSTFHFVLQYVIDSAVSSFMKKWLFAIIFLSLFCFRIMSMRELEWNYFTVLK